MLPGAVTDHYALGLVLRPSASCPSSRSMAGVGSPFQKHIVLQERQRVPFIIPDGITQLGAVRRVVQRCATHEFGRGMRAITDNWL